MLLVVSNDDVPRQSLLMPGMWSTESTVGLIFVLVLYGVGYWATKGTAFGLTSKEAKWGAVFILVSTALAYFLFVVLGWHVPECEAQWYC